MSNKQETIADIVAEMRNESHAGDESCLEWVAEKMRDALNETQSVIAKCMEILNRIPSGVPYDGLIDDVADELGDLRDSHVKPALAATPRNCDRPECAVTKAAQDVWRKEDGGKTAYYEWLLATAKKGGKQ